MFNAIKSILLFAIAPLSIGGGGGSSSSSATTNNTDKRLVVSGGVGVSNDGGSVTVNALDGGAIEKALEFAGAANAASVEGYKDMLKTTGTAVSGFYDFANKSLAQTNAALVQAKDTAQSEGTLNNRTITILGISAALALAVAMRK